MLTWILFLAESSRKNLWTILLLERQTVKTLFLWVRTMIYIFVKKIKIVITYNRILRTRIKNLEKLKVLMISFYWNKSLYRKIMNISTDWKTMTKKTVMMIFKKPTEYSNSWNKSKFQNKKFHKNTNLFPCTTSNELCLYTFIILKICTDTAKSILSLH